MTSPRPPSPSDSDRFQEMSEAERTLWQDLILKRNGHYFSKSRQGFLCRRLRERMSRLGIKGYYDYYKYVVFNSKGQKEWLTLQELILNSETSFFRHSPSFQALTQYVLPKLRVDKQKQQNSAITMWSAGCSTGQEAYSLAMTFSEAAAALPQSVEQGGWGGVRLRISGSDICNHAMEKARQGSYKAHELRFLPDYYLKQYLETKGEGTATIYQVTEKIRSRVQYGYLHLHGEESYWLKGQDVIFCQNVLIYFRAEDRLEIVTRLCQCLNPGGYLFLGPAEIVGLELPGMKLIRLKDVLIYQRTL